MILTPECAPPDASAHTRGNAVKVRAQQWLLSFPGLPGALVPGRRWVLIEVGVGVCVRERAVFQWAPYRSPLDASAQALCRNHGGGGGAGR